jgi:exopolyphosphatase/pppGpp-phosphohydrolase
MKIIPITLVINQCFQYVIHTSRTFNIDESHAVKHSLEVFDFTDKIFNNERMKNPHLEEQKEVIFASAILHDMCDKKYMSESTGIELIRNYMKDYLTEEDLNTVCQIVTTMSYSKVKKVGYPDLGNYQHAYHIVREADLLAAYDIDRCIIYSMVCEKLNYKGALERTIHLFNQRIFQYRRDKLFVTPYSKNASLLLHKKAVIDIERIKKRLELL